MGLVIFQVHYNFPYFIINTYDSSLLEYDFTILSSLLTLFLLFFFFPIKKHIHASSVKQDVYWNSHQLGYQRLNLKQFYNRSPKQSRTNTSKVQKQRRRHPSTSIRRGHNQIETEKKKRKNIKNVKLTTTIRHRKLIQQRNKEGNFVPKK